MVVSGCGSVVVIVVVVVFIVVVVDLVVVVVMVVVVVVVVVSARLGPCVRKEMVPTHGANLRSGNSGDGGGCHCGGVLV
jgi:hypothetical protein